MCDFLVTDCQANHLHYVKSSLLTWNKFAIYVVVFVCLHSMDLLVCLFCVEFDVSNVTHYHCLAIVLCLPHLSPTHQYLTKVADQRFLCPLPTPPNIHAHKLDQELVWWRIMCFVMLVVFFPILDACLLLLGSCNPGWLATETGSPRLNTVALHIILTVWGIYFTLNFYS